MLLTSTHRMYLAEAPLTLNASTGSACWSIEDAKQQRAFAPVGGSLS